MFKVLKVLDFRLSGLAMFKLHLIFNFYTTELNSSYRPGSVLKYVSYTLCIRTRSRFGPENESLQSEAGRSIFTSKFVFYTLQSQQNKNPKHSEFFTIICFETSLPYRYLTYRPRFDAARKVLCIVCIT